MTLALPCTDASGGISSSDETFYCVFISLGWRLIPVDVNARVTAGFIFHPWTYNLLVLQKLPCTKSFLVVSLYWILERT